MRLDLVLKQSGLIKRRTVAKELAERGRILINDRKPSGLTVALAININRDSDCIINFEEDANV